MIMCPHVGVFMPHYDMKYFSEIVRFNKTHHHSKQWL